MRTHSSQYIILPAAGFAPVVTTDTTASATSIIDCLGLDYVGFLLLTGTLADTDATFNVNFAYGDAVDSTTSPTSITDTATITDDGTLIEGPAFGTTAFTFRDDASAVMWTYKVNDGKRWIKATVTPVANTGNAPLAMAVLKYPRIVPPTEFVTAGT